MPYPDPLRDVMAIRALAGRSEAHYQTIRCDHESDPTALSPFEYVRIVHTTLRWASDYVVSQVSAAHMAIVGSRLDRLVDSIEASLSALASQPVDKVWCNDPACRRRGRHMLPGPWTEALRRSGLAQSAVLSLLQLLLPSSDAPSGSNTHSNAPPSSVPLLPDHEAILAVWGTKQKTCMTVIDASSAGLIRNRETVGSRLKELEKIGLVYRPYGKNKGYALTEAGRKRLPGASPT